MDNWQDIATAPKDGSRVYVRRIHNGRSFKEGWAVWGINSADAPMRQWIGGGFSPPIPPDHTYADTPRWLTEDRRFSFPTPTEWLPGGPANG